MHRKSSETESLVYAYAASVPLSGMEHIDLERERTRQLWNRLVGIDYEADSAIAQSAAADVPALAALIAAMAGLTARLREAARKDVRALLTERRWLERQTWPLLSSWRKANAQACMEIEDRRRARVIDARQNSGCYWGNYNNVLENYEVARKTVRTFGRRLRHIEPEPDYGCLTVQIQRTRSGLGASAAELQDGTFAHAQIGAVDPRAHDPHTFRGERRRLCRTTCEIRVDAAGNMARLPLVFHRPLPEDARIKSVQLTWRKHVWRACFTVSRPAVVRPSEGAGKARVKLAWSLAGSELRIADGDHPLSLPADWMRGMDRVASLHAEIEAAFGALDRDGSHYDLYDAIRAQHIVGRSSDAITERWYKLHDNRYREMIGLRKRLLGQRQERYRLWAHAVTLKYSRIEVEAPASLAAHAQAERGEEANSLRNRAALHSLLLILPHMARKHGCAVEIASAPVPNGIEHSKIRHISRKQRDKIESARKVEGNEKENQEVTG